MAPGGNVQPRMGFRRFRCARFGFAGSLLPMAAHRAGPQWLCSDVGWLAGGVAVRDRDLHRAGERPVNRCRAACWAVWWYGGVGGCAVVVGSAGGVAEQGVG